MPRGGANRPVRQRKGVTHYTDDNPSTFTVKPRRGETPLPPVPEERPRATPRASRKRKAPCKRPLPQAHDTILAHRTCVQPILPLVEFLPQPPQKPTHPSLHPGVPTACDIPSLPTWTDYGTTNSHETTTMTWLAVRADDPRYAVAGDVAGVLWLLGSHGRPLRTLHASSAAARPPHRRLNAILQAAWSHQHVLLLTRSELEGVDVANDTLLFTVPIEEDKRLGSAPVLAVRQHDFLWCTGKLLSGCWGRPDAPMTLRTLDLPMERCGSVVWETENDTFLCVVATASDGVELWRCRKEEAATASSSSDDETTPTTVLLRRPLPSTRNADCAIQQYDGYTFVCGRGVRMYQTSDLVLLTTMGESVQLHGQLTLWSRCCWLPRPPIRPSTIRNEKRSYWLEHADALAEPEPTDADETHFWLLGVPHPRKGPLELQTTLYFLSPDGATATTRDGPPKGCVGDVWVTDRHQWSVVALSAEQGRLVQLAPGRTSDFPGVMYPVGFQEITSQNIEYIEDEDELDVEPDEDGMALSSSFSHEEVEDDAELAEAMRQSLLEQKQQAKEPPKVEDPILEVLRPQREEDDDLWSVGAWPELSRSDSGDSVPGSPQQREHSHSTTCLLPHHMSHVRSAVELQRDEEGADEGSDAAAKPKPVPVKKRANIEALLQSSVNLELRQRMVQVREAWKTMTDDDALPLDDDTCSACRGRSVVHSCGQREMPVDHDAIARADRERHEQEQAEKHRKRLEKRKQAEAKRKEAKRLRKLEEAAEARRMEEEEQQRMLEHQQQQERSAAATPATPSAAAPASPYVSSAYQHQPPNGTYTPSVPQSPYFGSTFHINGNEVKPSTSLHPTDALAALAGLADSFSQPIPTPAVEPPTSPLNLLSSASVQVSEDAVADRETTSPPPVAAASSEQPAVAAPIAGVAVSTPIVPSSFPGGLLPAQEAERATATTAEFTTSKPPTTTDASQMALSALVMLCGAADPMQTTTHEDTTPELSKDTTKEEAAFVDDNAAAKGNGSNEDSTSNSTKVEG